MQILIALATSGFVLNLLLMMIAGRRLQRAAVAPTTLYALANVGFLIVVAAAIDPAQWRSALLLAPPLLVGFLWLRNWTAPARACFAFMASAAGLYVSYVFALTFLSSLGLLAVILSTILLLFEVAALSLTIMYTYEAFSALCRVRWSRRVTSAPLLDPTFAPFVAIHVPTYSEPPDLVIETLDALARLNYPAFEVILIDNNTKDPSLWEPVRRHCAELGERFRFFHVDPLRGFKAGACNFALAQTDPRAELVAIIDADYLVDPDFLRETTPHFRDAHLAFLQTPQDYRQYEGNRYLTDCLHAYAYFFAISMTARNEDNAPIFGGTMGLIRRSVLEQIGGWDEWCITEDAEASLRILKLGYRSLYVAKTFGRGLMPFDFDSYKKQRFRWAFGGMQIFRKHWRSLIPFWPRPDGDRLSAAQRFWYLAAVLAWCGAVVQLAFAAFLLVGAAGYVVGTSIVARPLREAILIFPLVFLGLGLIRFLWVLRSALGVGLSAAIGAAVSMFSLSWVDTQAVLAAAVHADGVFLRTSKTKASATLARVLQASRVESALAVCCLALAIAVLGRGLAGLGLSLALLCAWQAVIYGSSFATSLSAIRSAGADVRPARYRRSSVTPPAAAALFIPAVAAAVGLALFLALAGVAGSPAVAEQLNSDGSLPALLPQAILATPSPRPPQTDNGAAPNLPSATSPSRPITAPTVAPSPSRGPTSSPPVPPSPSQGAPSARPTLPPAASTPSAVPTPPVTPPSQPTPAGGQPSVLPTRPVTTPPSGSIQSQPSFAR